MFFFQKQHGNEGMDEKKINKNLKSCPKSPRFTVCEKFVYKHSETIEYVKN